MNSCLHSIYSKNKSSIRKNYQAKWSIISDRCDITKTHVGVTITFDKAVTSRFLLSGGEGLSIWFEEVRHSGKVANRATDVVAGYVANRPVITA